MNVVPEGKGFILAELWGFKVQACRRFVFGEAYITRQVLSPEDKIISTEEQLPDTEMAAGLQIRTIILNLPNQLADLHQKLSNTAENILEYYRQLEIANLYKADLETSKARLAEVDQLIIKRTEKENKKNSMSEPSVSEVVPQLGISA